MVLLAAAVCTKNGKVILSRQFVEMTRSRIEGLLSAFPKLINTGKQHTFVETESVRYVYQPIEKMYVLLITTKNSNILEDLETLRLFSRVIPEYCKTIDETDVQENVFNLIFAFDEIVALGYRESVNLAQIRTFTEMESHDEKLFLAVRQSQENETKVMMRKKAKELQQLKRDAMRNGTSARSNQASSGGFGSNGMRSGSADITAQTLAPEPSVPKPTPQRSTGRAMKLGAKSKDVDNFVDKLIAEGQSVRSVNSKSKKSDVVQVAAPSAPVERIHVRVEEKFRISADHNGGLDMELLGLFVLRINDPEMEKISVKSNFNELKGGLQMQTHPNVDKNSFKNGTIVSRENKPFPARQDLGLIKWRLKTTDEDHLPLKILCWPNDNGDGGCDVNLEYELQKDNLELVDILISIPLPSDVGSPNVSNVDGEYNHNTRKNILEWIVPVIDANNSVGNLDFTIAGQPDDFFPVDVTFRSNKKSYTDVQIGEIELCETNAPVKYSVERVIVVDKYEIA